MPDDLLDQSIVPSIGWQDILSGIDELIFSAVVEKDDDLIVGKCQTIIEGIQLRGVTLAKLFYEWKRNASEFGIAPDDWEDYVRAKTGRSLVTIRKYVDLWENVFRKVDGDIFWMLLGKPIQGLLLLPAVVKENQLTAEDWEEIADAEDAQAIRQVVRRVRGEVSNSASAIAIRLGRDGVLTAYRGEEIVAIGYLNFFVNSDVGKAAVERIINAAGIQRV